ncbi:methyl-accepting chemotaxis protein [Cronobacter dublinensis]|nr:methyl-accepting chemotaxis protein [Cronobacter dublinensis]
MNNLKFSQKIIMSLSIILALMLVMGALSLYFLSNNNKSASFILTERFPAVRYTLEMRGVLSELRLQQVQMIASTTLAEREKHQKELQQAIDNFLEAQNHYLRLYQGDALPPLARNIVNNFNAFSQSNRQVLAALAQEDIALASKISGDNSRQYRTQLMADLATLEKNEIAAADSEAARAAQGYASATWIQIILGIVALVASGVIAAVLTRNLMRQLGGEPAKAQAIAYTISQGDLSHPVTWRGDNNLLSSLGVMQNELRKLIAAIRHSAETVLNHADEIAAGNRELSARTEQQSAALIETAASMEQITSAVKNNADHTQQARLMAGNAASSAQQGGVVMSQVSGTMQAISASADRMTEIIALIEGIAFQTNILALNAAVEAARAGEHGKGFAVVAGEVRNLAHRSSEAAKDIRQLIVGTTDKMSEGASLVRSAESAMSDIIGNATRVRDLLDEVNMATQEQQRGIEQINLAIAELDNVTQSNASMVEELAGSADVMSEQVTRLNAGTRVFRLEAQAQ